MTNYQVPTMKEIEAIPWNGFNVCSTFSGGGGSCLGYRMAGYRVLYANEFVEEACKTYKANNPNSFLDNRDIRTVTGKDILKNVGLEKGELDVFDGSPPCSAFSTNGKREKGWGKRKNYSDNKKQVVDDLFFEYARILNEIQPKVFIAENVSGLAKGNARGYLKLIYNALKDCGYNVQVKILNASFFGVPQKRERAIFIGVRKDININPVYPKPNEKVITFSECVKGVNNKKNDIEYLFNMVNNQKFLRKCVQELPKNQSKPKYSKLFNSYLRIASNLPSNTITANCTLIHPTEDRFLTIDELKRVQSLPDDFILTGTYNQKKERIGRMVPPLMMKAISETVRDEILCKIN